MKYVVIVFTITVLLTACSPKGPIGGDSPEQLLTLFEKYHQNNDIKNMLRLYNTEGVEDYVLELEGKKLKSMFKRELIGTQIEELNEKARDFFNRGVQAQGRTITFNMEIIGQLMTNYTENRSDALLYGLKEERYYFALQVQK